VAGVAAITGRLSDAVKLMTVGRDSSDVSALYVLRQYAMLARRRSATKSVAAWTGCPGAMAASLAGIIRYNAPVFASNVNRHDSAWTIARVPP
jgi:hypothetical protein